MRAGDRQRRRAATRRELVLREVHRCSGGRGARQLADQAHEPRPCVASIPSRSRFHCHRVAEQLFEGPRGRIAHARELHGARDELALAAGFIAHGPRRSGRADQGDEPPGRAQRAERQGRVARGPAGGGGPELAHPPLRLFEPVVRGSGENGRHGRKRGDVRRVREEVRTPHAIASQREPLFCLVSRKPQPARRARTDPRGPGASPGDAATSASIQRAGSPSRAFASREHARDRLASGSAAALTSGSSSSASRIPSAQRSAAGPASPRAQLGGGVARGAPEGRRADVPAEPQIDQGRRAIAGSVACGPSPTCRSDGQQHVARFHVAVVHARLVELVESAPDGMRHLRHEPLALLRRRIPPRRDRLASLGPRRHEEAGARVEQRRPPAAADPGEQHRLAPAAPRTLPGPSQP